MQLFFKVLLSDNSVVNLPDRETQLEFARLMNDTDKKPLVLMNPKLASVIVATYDYDIKATIVSNE